MKCPCCHLVIEDERKQVIHTERCHPQLLEERWEQANMHPDDMAGEFAAIALKYPDLVTLIDECKSLDIALNMLVTPGQYAKVVLVPRNRGAIEATGPTLMAALCLAMDIMEYAAP